MSANIHGARFLSVREPAWHKIGKVVDQAPDTVLDGFRQCDMLYSIIKAPISAMVPTGGRPRSITYPNRFALMREPLQDDNEWAPLGIVSDDYEVVQNEEIAQMLDDMGITRKWSIETIGSLGKGETIFVSFDCGSSKVLGLDTEELKGYFLVTETRGGSTSFKIVYTPVRVVCQNTLNLGLKEATTTFKVAHTRNARQRAEDSIKLMAGLDKSITSTMHLFDKLASMKVNSAQALDIIAKAYPAPSKPARLSSAEEIFSVMPEMANAGLSSMWETDALQEVSHVWDRERGRVEGLRSKAQDLFFRFNDEHPNVAMTSWAVINAVVENEDYRDGPETMYESTLWGSRARTKARAMSAVLQSM